MKLHFKSFGDDNAPPLLILHGLFGMLDNWQTLGRKFAETYRVYLIDQRNHGKSPHSLEFDYYLMADDLLEFMDEHDIEKAHLIGHSMGGKTVMQFAVENPNRVNKLVVVDISPEDYPAGHDDIFKALFDVNIDLLQSRSEADEALKSLVEEKGVRQFLLKNLTRNKSGGYQWKFNLQAIHFNYANILANSLTDFDVFEGDTLFVKGGKSERYMQAGKADELIVAHFPKAKIEVVEDAGHWVHAEQPDAFFEVVSVFLGWN
ncbi:MAG: alpha/beta fold hydrolase [Chitinophagales bacterium]